MIIEEFHMSEKSLGNLSVKYNAIVQASKSVEAQYILCFIAC